MGLAPFFIYFTWEDIRTDEPRCEQLRCFWIKIFTISFVVQTGSYVHRYQASANVNRSIPMMKRIINSVIAITTLTNHGRESSAVVLLI
ncbi:hypothetical protein SAMN05443574_11585 [Haloarcula vallismortis]|uniref:Cytochrome d ubiquinol oxidase subunit I n=3 Tax=Haloarcula vallismortis TaxID=28442 RepID=M0J838_HALVA|nr:cytochrome d ubiquinol oxidase subunit I [Haloarcula vallismortis ATCC 29715]SDX14199.1 hypothetical protein SAMN05443574_11585 [Haloarcula vallismortis]